MLLIALASLLAYLASIVHSGGVEDKYSCPHGWTRYGSRKCLKYVNELQDYERAQTTCKAKNQGTLVTVHSHDEQNFVYSYIHSIAASSTPIWLGAKQIDFESILWLDKSENSYTNWAPSEPSHPDEICIAINPRNGLWHDVMCTEANVPACERAPTTQWPFFVAFCSEGWFQFNDEKCVRIISSQALNFYESQELCRSKYNSKLLSIKTDKESEFLHNLIKFRDVKLPVWLGAVQNDFSSFNWIDKSEVTFTNWAEGEPNDPDHACLSMTASGAKWADDDCKEQKLILCQKAVPEDSSCETGWLQFRQDKCYRFVHIRLAFDDAELLCNNLYGGHLPSIHSQEEQFMISQFLASVNVKNGSEIWLGGRQMDFHNFNWGDGSLFNYSYWEHGEPNFPAEKCIEMSWRNGRWNDINCRLKRAVLCERQVSSRHSIKPNLYQPITCLDSNCTTPTTLSATGPAGVSPELLMTSPSVTALAGAADPELLLNNSSNASSPGTIAAVAAVHQLLTGELPVTAMNSNSSLLVQNYSAPISLTVLDDKPIKVINSIFQREQVANVSGEQSTGGALINVTSSAEPVLLPNGTSIHYNLSPPGELLNSNLSPASPVSSQQSLLLSSAVSSSELDSTIQGRVDQIPSESIHPQNEGTRTSTMSQQVFDNPTMLLLDKLKPSQVQSSNSSSSAPAAPASAPPAPIPTAAAPVTAPNFQASNLPANVSASQPTTTQSRQEQQQQQSFETKDIANSDAAESATNISGEKVKNPLSV